MNATLNKMERRAQALLSHYAACERLALALGMPAAKIDGKLISVALWKIERDAHNAATAQCNGEAYSGQPYREECDANSEEAAETPWSDFCDEIDARVEKVLGAVPRGFFYNKDPRGYALKIDPDVPAGRELIEATGMHKDWGGNGILSPEITGDR